MNYSRNWGNNITLLTPLNRPDPPYRGVFRLRPKIAGRGGYGRGETVGKMPGNRVKTPVARFSGAGVYNPPRTGEKSPISPIFLCVFRHNDNHHHIDHHITLFGGIFRPFSDHKISAFFPLFFSQFFLNFFFYFRTRKIRGNFVIGKRSGIPSNSVSWSVS